MPQQMTLFGANDECQKALGAYYTDELVADFLVAWAVRRPTDLVMDPGFGDGAFLKSACKRVLALGGTPSAQVLGLEINSRAHSATASMLFKDFNVSVDSLRSGDFFDLAPETFQVDAVVGNPPFVRYQRFSGRDRNQALSRARSQGVELSELTSSWAPFLIHAVSMIKPGGRLAMVAPFELSHASYARPVLRHLMTCFGEIILLTFRRKLFQWLNEDTLLILASERGAGLSRLLLRDLSGPNELVKLLEDTIETHTDLVEGSEILDHRSLSRGGQRLINYLIPGKIRQFYEELKSAEMVFRLGDLASVGIGYVTGANDFFHMSPSQAKTWGIPDAYLCRAIRRGRALAGTRFTDQDWKSNLQSGETGYLLLIDGDSSALPAGLANYLEHGVHLGIPKAFKCRTRSPWYKVPHVHRPDAFLTYMSGAYPKLVANSAEVVAPNSLHIVRLHKSHIATPDRLATLWQNSLTGLSVEIEGHALGGGMLKMEPTEARNVMVPVVEGSIVDDLCDEVDGVCRGEGTEAARSVVDNEILRKHLGLSGHDCELLRKGARILAERRSQRGRGRRRVA